MEAMIHYLTDPEKTDNRGIFGIGLNPSFAVTEMRLVQMVYHRESLPNPYIQVILSFDKWTSIALTSRTR